MSYTLRFSDTLDNWNSALEQIMAVPSYRKFFAKTSPSSPIVVPNMKARFIVRDDETARYKCYLDNHTVEGQYISGWTVSCAEVFADSPASACILTYHRNIMLDNGSMFNPNGEDEAAYHIFIRDDSRYLEYEDSESYNQRVWFTKEMSPYENYYCCRAMSETVYFARENFIDRDVTFEMYQSVVSIADFINVASNTSTPYNDLEKWVQMCTNVTICLD